ncbi:MAG: PD-(D/E)XK nuclease family protein [Mycobacterium sp.]
MLRNLGATGKDKQQVVVFNDEAHHCYSDRPVTSGDKLSAEEKDANEQARVWFKGLQAVAKHVGVKQIYDLSATPYYLAGSGYHEGHLFPWTVSDFSLMDAIESGIVKVPRTPVDDDADHPLVTYLRLWDFIGDKLPKRAAKGKPPPRRSSRKPACIPSKRQGGLGVFHVIPEEAIADADRYRGTVEDETRLFYVAVTRAQKYLAVTYSPGPNRLYRSRSELFDHCAEQTWVSTKPSTKPLPARIKPHALQDIPQVTFSFSELKYLFECPYSFKLRFLYGFNPPLHEALGYGKGLHDALSEVHKKAVDGEIVDASAAEDLVARHLHTPFAYPELRATLERSAVAAIERYFATHGEEIPRTVHSEKQIQVHIAPGVTVDGRIDLIRRLETDELSIVDFKSTDRAQAEDVTRDQLHVYAVGYEELTGEDADLIEVLNLDEQGKSTREEIESSLLTEVKTRIKGAGDALRSNDLPRHGSWCPECEKCDLAGLCRNKP